MKGRVFLLTLGVVLLLISGAGCASVGEAASGVGSLFNLAFYLALIALPFALGYYTWYRD